MTALRRGSGIALWRQIESRLTDDIAGGALAAGSRLPTEAELAARFGVNRHTVRQALAALAERGLVRVEQGRGSFVQQDVLDYAIGKRTRFSENIARMHRAPGGELLRAADVAADATTARHLKLRTGTKVVLLETLGRADGRPISIGTHHFPAARFSGLAQAYAETGSISKALARFRVADYTRAVTRVTAAMPTADEAALLQQPRNRPILVAESVNIDRDGVPIDYGIARFASDRVQIVFES